MQYELGVSAIIGNNDMTVHDMTHIESKPCGDHSLTRVHLGRYYEFVLSKEMTSALLYFEEDVI